MSELLLSEIRNLQKLLEEISPTWQPISTAPKNGTDVLGWCRAWAGHVVQVRYLTGLDRWNTAMQPTHWLPLPAPPSVEQLVAAAAHDLAGMQEEAAHSLLKDAARLKAGHYQKY